MSCCDCASVRPPERLTSLFPEGELRRKALALALLPGVGPSTYHSLRAKFGSAPRAFDDAPGLRGHVPALERADDLLATARDRGMSTILSGDATYPAPLLELADPPPCLFALGNLALLDRPAVAIVGTRRATPYGERVTRELATALARSGLVILSGMARGIDAAAHRAALDATGATIAVLGTGVDLAYPRGHRDLHRRIAVHGLLLSEEFPGDRASPGSFPKRNRIIAALARATIIVEAPFRSGALITAGHALDLHRDLAAVPGRIDDPQSAGSNELLRDGAQVIASVADALALVGATPPVRAAAAIDNPAEEAIWNALGGGALSLDALASRSGLPARECLAAVTALELRGAIECALTGEIRRR